ncbi:uncharacterized protein G2W53_000356 [Senna tora]|uniref:Uncharacterized protein n=1 Tax=Senna tora TaxID=362788 RepID=A0A835CJD9_9FABA|nr:uncharacterized protein G2W53_000356 [Senna tora]
MESRKFDSQYTLCTLLMTLAFKTKTRSFTKKVYIKFFESQLTMHAMDFEGIKQCPGNLL